MEKMGKYSALQLFLYTFAIYKLSYIIDKNNIQIFTFKLIIFSIVFKIINTDNFIDNNLLNK